ncbi:MAG: hypothetical protein WCA55_20505, partial [Xanthobacteraceae bacterium]
SSWIARHLAKRIDVKRESPFEHDVVPSSASRSKLYAEVVYDVKILRTVVPRRYATIVLI